jgi:hypothetical protein
LHNGPAALYDLFSRSGYLLGEERHDVVNTFGTELLGDMFGHKGSFVEYDLLDGGLTDFV